MTMKKYEKPIFQRHLGVPTKTPAKGQFVALDVEAFGQEQKKLHRPHGFFGALVITFGRDSWLITDWKDVAPALKVVKPGRWVMHNAGYDVTQLRGWGAKIPNRFIWDIMTVEKVLWSGLYTFFNLGAIVRRYFDHLMLKEVRDTFHEIQVDGTSLPKLTEEQRHYTYEDGEWTLLVAEHQEKLLKDTGNSWDVYHEIEEPYFWALLDMMPVHVSPDDWHDLADDFLAKGLEMQEELGFNVKSVPQCKSAVLEATGIQLKSTGAGVLEGHFGVHSIFQDIIIARKYRDAYSKYGANWIANHVEDDDLVYPDWKGYGTVTARTACASPNIQNIPVRDPYEQGFWRYRQMFTTRFEGGTVLVSDVSQQEPRITAFLSQDASLIKAFEDGEDIHQVTTDKINEISKRKITRKEGKNIGLGVTYGKTAMGLSKDTGATVEEAEQFIDDYFTAFPGVRELLRKNIRQMYRKNYITTAYGRRIWINPYNEGAERHCINYPIQGGAGDMTKMTVIKVHRKAKKDKMPYRLTMQVHDEVVADCLDNKELSWYIPVVNDAWIDSADMMFPGVPFKTDVSLGNSWAEDEEQTENKLKELGL